MGDARVYDEEFDRFVRSAWPRLRQIAFVLTLHTQDAEDLLQTVLARTYARWRQVRRDDPVAYVRRGLTNAYIDSWRRKRVLRVEPADVEADTGPAYVASDRVSDRSELAERLGVLSKRERTIVVLRYYLDLPEAEVADALGCSVGTVKSTASRALARLRVPTEVQEVTR